MNRGYRWIEGRCRHLALVASKTPSECPCSAGEVPAERQSTLTPAAKGELGTALDIAWPCTSGLRAGLICPRYEPYSESEIGWEAEATRMACEPLGAAAGQCQSCGAPLALVKNWSGAVGVCLPCGRAAYRVCGRVSL